MTMNRVLWARGLWVAVAVLAAMAAGAARAAMGMTEIAASGVDGPMTVYYPSDSPSRPGPGPFALDVAADGTPVRGNCRLVVVTHGAGGHTALTLAGGRWSYANFRRHCDADLAADFQFCVGVVTQLTGGVLDGFKQWVARAVIGWRFADETMRGHEDARVAAVVAAVPAAATHDMASLASPRVPLALVTAGQDRWLVPRFHADRVLQACSSCEHLADLERGGHGAYLSPLPPGLHGVLAQMLADPPGFDRTVMPAVHAKVADFFRRRLLP